MSRSQALAAVVDDPIPPNDAIDRPASVRGQLSTSDRTRLVEATAANWPHAVRANGISEGGPAPRVNRGWLETTLGNDWRWAAIDVEGDPDSPLLQYQVVTSADEYTALLADGVLTRVIGQQRLARSIAKSYLEKRLGS